METLVVAPIPSDVTRPMQLDLIRHMPRRVPAKQPILEIPVVDHR
jgi:hypothetical protein